MAYVLTKNNQIKIQKYIIGKTNIDLQNKSLELKLGIMPSSTDSVSIHCKESISFFYWREFSIRWLASSPSIRSPSRELVVQHGTRSAWLLRFLRCLSPHRHLGCFVRDVSGVALAQRFLLQRFLSMWSFTWRWIGLSGLGTDNSEASGLRLLQSIDARAKGLIRWFVGWYRAHFACQLMWGASLRLIGLELDCWWGFLAHSGAMAWSYVLALSYLWFVLSCFVFHVGFHFGCVWRAVAGLSLVLCHGRSSQGRRALSMQGPGIVLTVLRCSKFGTCQEVVSIIICLREAQGRIEVGAHRVLRSSCRVCLPITAITA